MKSKKFIIILAVIAAVVLFGIIYGSTQCSSDPIEIESTNLTTTYIGNYNCPNLKVKVKNTSKSTYYVYIDVNFYYKGEFASSKSSAGVTLMSGDSYTFSIQSTSGTYLYMDEGNWTYKITNIHTIEK